MGDIYLFTNDGFICNIIFLFAFLVIYISLGVFHPYANKTLDAFVQAFKINAILLMVSVIFSFFIAQFFSMSDRWVYSILLVFTDSPIPLGIAIIALSAGTIVEEASNHRIKWMSYAYLVTFITFLTFYLRYFLLVY